jgi:hypothetical protein
MKDQGDVVVGRAPVIDLSAHQKPKLRSLDATVMSRSESKELIEFTVSA